VERRKAAVPDVEAIIKDALHGFETWREEMMVSPTIHKLKGALEQIRKDELSHYTKKLDEEQLALVEQVTKRMMQKIINVPVIQLKAACKRGEAETLMDVLNSIFDLEGEAQNALVEKH
jgi:glutamyl-tRNA reductase